uniref:Uncharacterized protein n=1 Tax=viral metagenome TaxID=1070528 RepID=A0A6M3KB86_9ZZZZ
MMEDKPIKPEIEQSFDNMEIKTKEVRQRGIEEASKFNNSTNKILAFWSVTNSLILTTKFAMEILGLDLKTAYSRVKEIIAEEG